MTHEDLVVALNEKEAAGAARTTFKPNNIHNLKDEHFRRELGDYMVDESSLFVFHVFQESRGFHPLTGEKQTRAMAQMYTPEVFKMMKESRGFEGMQVYVAHDPTQPLTEEQRAFAVEKGWVKS